MRNTSAYQVRKLGKDAWDRWDAFVKTAPHGTLYHTSHWLEQAGRLGGTSPAIWAVYKGSALIGGCVFQEETDGERPAGVLGPCTQYNGLLVNHLNTMKPYRHERALNGIVAALTREFIKHYRSVTVVNSHHVRDIRPFLWSGWKVSPRYTYVWNTGSPQKLLTPMHGDARRQIRIAQGKIEIKRSVRCSEVLRLWRLSFKKKGLKVRLKDEDLERCFGALAIEGMAEAYLAVSDAVPVAGLTILKYKEEIYLWFNGLDPRHRSSGGHTYLLWHVMNRHRNDSRHMDLCGGDIPEVAMYKASLGAVLTSHFQCILEQEARKDGGTMA